MKTAVRYFSKSGNTKKLADAIASVAGTEALDVTQPLPEKVEVLFLGASVYWGGISPEVKTFIRSLESGRVGKAVVFSTSAMAQRAFPQIKKELAKAGIAVAEDNFYCRGEFLAMHKGRPDAKDLKAAGVFAQKAMK